MSSVPIRRAQVSLRSARRAVRMGGVRQANPNGYAMDSRVAGVLEQICGGLPGGFGGVIVRPVRFYHRVAISATAANNALFTFFNTAKQNGVTNFPQANGLPANFGLALQAVAFDIEQGVTIAGAAAATGAVASNSANQSDVAEQVRLLYKNAIVNLAVGDKPIIDNWYGLDAFPSGRSLQIDGALATTATTTTTSIAAVQNGAPLNANLGYFNTPFPIMSGQQLQFTAAYQTGLPLTGGGVLKAELIGLLVSPAAA